MEFSEKLQQLRKQENLTQEQLADKLFVSRTAVSKWESGKGYPNIDSLKRISNIFHVSIDDLLSGEELITLAASENRSYMSKVFSLIYGVLDLMAIAFIFLPFYGNVEGDYIRAVSLIEYQEVSSIRIVFFIILILITVLGIAEIVMQFFVSEKWLNAGKTFSVVLHATAILFFILTRQPYVTFFLFMLFIIKIIISIKNARFK